MTRLPPTLNQRLPVLVAQNPRRLDPCRNDWARRLFRRRFCMPFPSVRYGDSCTGKRGERPINGIQLIQQFFALRVQHSCRAIEIDHCRSGDYLSTTSRCVWISLVYGRPTVDIADAGPTCHGATGGSSQTPVGRARM